MGRGLQRSVLLPPRQRQQRLDLSGSERANVCVSQSQDGLDVRGGAVAESHPEHFWRRTTHKTTRQKVVVLGDDHEIASRSVLPDDGIVGAILFKLPDMGRPGIQIGQLADEPPREVVVGTCQPE